MLAPGIGSASTDLPSFSQIKAGYRTSDSTLLDRHGQVLHLLRTDPYGRRLPWVTLSEISPALRTAVLLSEDRRFYEHTGVDWSAISAAAWANLWNTRTRGASTVTMQLAGLLDRDLAVPQGGRSVRVKLGQASAAWQLEKHWRKDQILEAYLNLVGFRGEVVGIAALSAQLFQKHPNGLNLEEAAIAAALVRAPNAPAAQVAQRACEVLRQQQRAQGCSWVRAWTAQVLAAPRLERLNADEQLAPYLAQRLLGGSKAASPSVRSTLDARLQRFARDALRQQLRELREQNVQDGALIVIDNASGDVLAWIGSSGSLSQAAQVDGVLAPRQAGSTLKPFLYETAIAQRWLTAASILDDSPVGLNTGAGLYIPQNYDRRFKGLVSVRTALGSSLNIPAVRALVLVGPDRFVHDLRRLGLDLPRDGGHYGYSLALGSAEVTLAQLSNAYRTLGNGGQATPLRLRISDVRSRPHPVLDPASSFIVADILSDREARVPTFGLQNALAARYWAAVKTGTSKDMRDNWCVGFSPRYTVGVWVGNASGEPMWNVSGSSGAAPIWRTVMDELYRRDRSAGISWQAPSPPPGVVRQDVRFEGQLEAARSEWLLPGTEQSQWRLASAQGSAVRLITAPADRSIMALDPDIPPGAQRLSLRAIDGLPRHWSWRLNGRQLGPAVPTAWPMWPGRHELELLDAKGRTVERLSFEVRGASLNSRAPTKKTPRSP